MQEIKDIGYIVGVAGRPAKLKAIEDALEGSLTDVLITDHITAEKLIDGQW